MAGEHSGGLQQAAFNALLRDITVLSDVHALRDRCDTFLDGVPGEQRLEVASSLSYANPFYVPDMDEDEVGAIAVTPGEFNRVVLRARLTGRASRAPKLILACAPKSASTFISNALCRALQVPQVSLFAPTASCPSASALGGNLKEQETDELAVMRHAVSGRGFLAQHHMRCTPYLCRQMEVYGIKPIVSVRNIFDTFVSLDDMFLDWRKVEVASNPHFFDDGLPLCYTDMDREDRLLLLVDLHCTWYIKFLATWQKCEAAGLVKPFWLSYERDFLADKDELADRLARFVGYDMADPTIIAESLTRKDGADKLRLNKGVAGRGDQLPEKVRARILDLFHIYRAEGDFSLMLGEAG